MIDAKRILPGILLFVLWALPAWSSPWVDIAPTAVAEAAGRGLPRFLDAIPANQMYQFGFLAEDEMARATLSDPFRTYTIRPADLLSFEGGQDITSIVRATSLWTFPVVSSGEPRALLTVDLMGGEWRAVDLAGSPLAAEMASVGAYVDGFAGWEARYLRIYQAACSFVLLTRDDEARLVPLESGALILGLIHSGERYEYTTVDPSEAILALAPIVRENLGPRMEE